MNDGLTPSMQGTDRQELINIFCKAISGYTEDEQQAIRKAWDYLRTVSEGAVRECGEPYYLHPTRVALILAEKGLDAESVIAGLFHNILAFENADTEYIAAEFGAAVASIISGTARITNLKMQNRTIQQADSMRKMLFAMADDIRIILVKMADKLDRIRNLQHAEEAERKQTAQEVLDIWAPLANRLGISTIKSEMEDLSLKFTNPEVFQQLKKIVALKKTERAEYLERAKNDIYRAASRAGMDISISSRAKHFYSIYQKMRKRGKNVEELYDLLAIRIICSAEAECYTLVGIVHGLWKPMDGRFKDYIAMPKANGYQSLHTTVICEGKPLEIQIRTQQMHAVAEHGVASHWLYKKGTNRDKVDIESLSIINRLREMKNERLGDEEFFNEMKDELLKDSIFVFTPKGDVVELPQGSTAIDFAYRIHTAIGQKLTGAKADGQIIPLSVPLRNTQIIEVMTGAQAHPTVNQLEHVRTAKARSKIRAWLQQNDPTCADWLDAKKEAAAEEQPETRPHERPRAHKKGDPETIPDAGSDGYEKIRIGNTTNFLISKAGCCNPSYGDNIIGYVSLGRGIIIHKADCPDFARIPDIEHRAIEVMWDASMQGTPPDSKKK